MAVTRRCFLKSLAVVPALPALLAPSSGLYVPWSRQAATTVRSEEITLDTAGIQAGERHGLKVGPTGELALDTSAAATGDYLSPILVAQYPFDALALTWQAFVPDGAGLALAVRASDDGISWGDWIPMPESFDLREISARHYSDLALAHGRYLQWSARLSGGPGAVPRLSSVTVAYIDAGMGPRSTELPLWNVGAQPEQGLAAPYIISRAAWGCPEPYGSPSWPPEYANVHTLIVHHTTDRNDYSDGAAVMRATWQDHAIARGWGDIGYNYLVDRFGHIYQGRYGGDNVIGGHAAPYNTGSSGISAIGNFDIAQPPQVVLDALSSLLSWLVSKYGLDPFGSCYFIDKTVANICGHRDVNATACPGQYLYAQMAWLRQHAINGSPAYAEAWLGHNTPPALEAGQTVAVSVTVRNQGTLTWPAGGSNPVHLGYHWYDVYGTKYDQSPEEDHRTPLGHDILPGQSVTLSALLTAPHTPGSYTLKWDMVHELVTWFNTKGCPTLDVPILVVQPPQAELATSPAALHFLAAPDRSPAPQVFFIDNTGSGTLNFAAAPDRTWCNLSQTSGAAPAHLTVWVDPGAIAPGTSDQATITVTAAGAIHSPQQVTVTLVRSALPLSNVYVPSFVR